jgi:hypothetical protein
MQRRTWQEDWNPEKQLRLSHNLPGRAATWTIKIPQKDTQEFGKTWRSTLPFRSARLRMVYAPPGA